MSKVILSWKQPAKRTDGTSLGINDIASYSVFRGTAHISDISPSAALTFVDNGVSGTDVYTVQVTLTDGTTASASVTPTAIASPEPVSNLSATAFA